ncbi:PadR family transcriptional regulator [Bifidobacterium scardovii]|uniref:PadR family transcriptional regulator n=1 Tax=Bifidobacterium scardovii TaxID=158787 RepID=UPI0005B5723A|nr:PadR family transcriptional regulator [Bifidobacterium scardovii]MDK6349516.1 PadR family transcriptional regulator [Bifidobacterium scardovii]MDU8982638.1 PadR family transcriptional regulator [Bifidobacterium scardovii]BAQ30788.1 putative transcription regulator [Bifidobacterium scardovii JCM 12489 = DSM 13734]
MNDIKHDPQEARWPALWVRAAMRTAILVCLEAGPLHGYAIALALEGLGFGRPKGGSLYPILEELKSADAVEDEWEQSEGGPGRRVYRLTAAGEDRLARERGQWGAMVLALEGGGVARSGDDAKVSGCTEADAAVSADGIMHAVSSRSRRSWPV